jgi:NADPH:quinone reductase-like Zn-dependent oxidoreductase
VASRRRLALRAASIGRRRASTEESRRVSTLRAFIEAVGANVTRFKPGDAVFGATVFIGWANGGTYAEYVGRARQGVLKFTTPLAALEALRAHLESQTLTPSIARTFPLEQAASALQCMTEGKTVGRIVVRASHT